ncbi:MAG TPA: MFS transporter [Gemmatimonadaceae bacterium]|nr:MFS transporter [Gemmatimonadaceae bacterium]
MPASTEAAKRDPYAALRYSDYRYFLTGRLAATMGGQMIDVAIGWELYERTNRALALGFVGLVQVVPIILLALPAGHLADRFDRKRIAMLSLLLLITGSLALAAISFTVAPIPLIYVTLFAIGVALSFHRPAVAALLPQLVPAEKFANAVTWNSVGWQLASVVGPALGGLIIAWRHHAGIVYIIDAALMMVFVICLTQIRGRQVVRVRKAVNMKTLLGGVRFVWHTKVILAAITLDLFAVLFGGATTLLPVFAKDILHVGAEGFGWLRAAPSIGAVLVAVLLLGRAPMQRAGRSLLVAVAGFGIATIVFGLSHSFPLSLLMLVLAGGLDMISVVVRQTLVQLRTPDEMRGRVSAVNSVFIDTSNELGGFESGASAALLGPVVSVVGGGIVTVLVVSAVAIAWPELRGMRSLTDDLPALTRSEEP